MQKKTKPKILLCNKTGKRPTYLHAEEIGGYAFHFEKMSKLQADKSLAAGYLALVIAVDDEKNISVSLMISSFALHIPVLVIYENEINAENVARHFQSGMADFIQRPFQHAELAVRICNMLLQKSMSQTSLPDFVPQIKEDSQISPTAGLPKLSRTIESVAGNLAAQVQITNEFMNRIGKLIRSGRVTEKREEIQKQLILLRKEFSELTRMNLESRLLEVDTRFIAKLTEMFPMLNPHELKLCAMFRMNLDTYQIAAILFISYDGLRKARYRLRKKLGLNKSVKLSKFLQDI